MEQKRKIVVGLSGGLDSACTALRYAENGWDVTGVFLRMFRGQSQEDARRAAAEIGIPFSVIGCEDLFENGVIRPFLSEYAKGRTPNPCVLCNPRVKIGELCRFAKEHGIDRVATGHYAGIGKDENSGRYYIRVSRHLEKDQSYMLGGLSQSQLSMLELPLETAEKEELRSAGLAAGLSSAALPESQDICFLPEGDYAAFIESRLGKSPIGNFVNEKGEVLGRHNGIIRYTVGQRRGLGVSAAQRLFVKRIDPQTNEVVLSDTDVFSESFAVTDVQLQKPARICDGERYFCKVRYAAKPVPVSVFCKDDRIICRAERPVRAVAPGQFAVFYDGDSAGSAVCFAGFLSESP